VKIQVDKGKEFYNKDVKAFLKQRDVTMFSSENNDIKCAVAEAAIRGLKSRIWRLMRHRDSCKFYDRLQDLVHSYNRTIHSAHGMRPAEVTQHNSLEVFNRLYADLLTSKHQKPKYSIGDLVRIAVEHKAFQKEYEGGFKHEVFRIYKVIRHRPRVVYNIEDLSGDRVLGSFYDCELTRVRQ